MLLLFLVVAFELNLHTFERDVHGLPMFSSSAEAATIQCRDVHLKFRSDAGVPTSWSNDGSTGDVRIKLLPSFSSSLTRAWRLSEALK